MQLTGLQVFSAVAAAGVQTEGLMESSDVSQTAGSFISPNIDLYYFDKDDSLMGLSTLAFMFFLCF